MRGQRSTLLLAATLTALALPTPVFAQNEGGDAELDESAEARPNLKASAQNERSENANGNGDKPSGDKPSIDKPSGDQAIPAAPTANALPSTVPPDAAAALVRAWAAYEYGDMNQVVEAARPVAEGLLPASREEQAQAFRLLGVGLFLTNRPLGAETAFTELLRKDPRARRDPTTTRPELVAFFESLRHQHLARERSARKLYWNFIPPVGQFQNGDNVKGWIVLGVGLASLTTAATSKILLVSWKQPGEQSSHPEAADKLKAANFISTGVLAAVYIYGVFDGLIGYGKPIDDDRPPVSLRFFPGGGGLGFTF